MLKILCSTGEAFETPEILRFGGFFFGVRTPEVKELEYSDGVLFDPSNVLFGQENSLMESFRSLGIKTVVTKEAFIFHYKSVTVKKSGYEVGKLSAKNSNLKYYHTGSNSADGDGHHDFTKSDGALGEAMTTVVAIASNGVDDLLLMSERLWREKGCVIRYLSDSRDLYDVAGVDILLVFLPSYQLTKVRQAKPTLEKIAVATDEVEKWMSSDSIGYYDVILTTEEFSQGFLDRQPFTVNCIKRCPAGEFLSTRSVPVKTLAGGSRYSTLVDVISHHGSFPGGRRRACFNNEKRHQLCVIARAYSGQDITSFLSLARQESSNMEVRIFVLNTDADSEQNGVRFTDRIKALAASSNEETGRCNVHLLEPPFQSEPSTYGYDLTDWALEALIDSAGCTHFLTTNADNYYIPGFLAATEENINKGKELIAFDFLTHHPRDGTNVINVKLERKFIDLGSFVTSAEVIRKSGATFLPNGLATEELFARDWFFVDKVQKYLKENQRQEQISLIHKVLYSHQ
mmetsp:Transcript_14700/g.29993  ORF Transcript_14700/g.29993 Transcript_14700/m.29993 type:complete len:515 (+) Transcript_14700:2-1546(+)